ncbi:MAG TPA: hypothetical protein VGH28_10980 [Polyangiaceae bacterium]|jgi:DNA-binding MarR family transcriptional regulator
MDELPAGVTDFIQKHLSSVEQIAVLRLLRDDPSRTWAIGDIASELRSSPVAITRRIEDLERSGVLLPREHQEEVRYAPSSSETSEAIARVIETYRSRPDRVIEAIYSKPDEALLAFADAFKLKKEKP